MSANVRAGYAADREGNFVCPNCGGTYFSTRDTSPQALSEQGHPVRCKDELCTGCKWTGLMRPLTPRR